MRGWIPCPNPDCLDGVVAWRVPDGPLRVEACLQCDGRLWIRDRRTGELHLRPVPVVLLLTLAVLLVCAGFLAGRLA
jgi:hypothetical protein